jgi:hypothetical protein
VRAKFTAVKALIKYPLILTEPVRKEQCSTLRDVKDEMTELDYLDTQNTIKVNHMGYIWNFAES